MTHSNGSHPAQQGQPGQPGQAKQHNANRSGQSHAPVNVHDVIGNTSSNDEIKAAQPQNRNGRHSDPAQVRDFAGEPGVLLDGPNVSTQHVLLVGNEAFCTRIAKRFSQARLVVKTASASDYLMALGQASHVRPDVVIGQVEGLDQHRQAIITGLRRLAPAVKLIVIAEPEKEAVAVKAVEAGFDDYLLEPVEANVLADVLLQGSQGGHASGKAGRPDAFIANASASMHLKPSEQQLPLANATMSRTEVEDRTPWRAGSIEMASNHNQRPEPSQTLEKHFVQKPVPSPTAQQPKSETSLDAHKQPQAPQLSQQHNAGHMYGDDPYDTTDAELGDIDLVDCLLTEPAAFESLVLKLVAGRSGVADVAFTANASDVPQDHSGAWVTFRGQRLGVLHAPPPSSKTQLAPWATWMAHWVAMQQQMTTLWNTANKDELTGAWNRRFFDRHLARAIAQASQKRFPVTVLMFDIDNFKTYNDRYGHAAGDEILRETVRLMNSVIREHDIVARIGGDEFAVVFWDPHGPRKPNSSHPDDVRDAARRFQQAICSHHFPKLLEEAPGTLTISGGLASYPWDGVTAQSLVERADTMLLHSKTQGKNAITFGAGVAHSGDPFEHDA